MPACYLLLVVLNAFSLFLKKPSVEPLPTELVVGVGIVLAGAALMGLCCWVVQLEDEGDRAQPALRDRNQVRIWLDRENAAEVWVEVVPSPAFASFSE